MKKNFKGLKEVKKAMNMHIVFQILAHWEIFMEYFQTDGPLILRNFFNSFSAKIVVTFLSGILPIFNQSIDALQVL